MNCKFTTIPLTAIFNLIAALFAFKCIFQFTFRSITEGNVEEFELRCGLAARGMSRTGTGRVQTRSGRVATSTTPLLTINAMQAELLPNTKPIT